MILQDTTARVWNPESGVCRQVLRGHTGGICAILPHSACEGRVLTCARDCTIRVWGYRLGHCLSVLRGHMRPVRSCLTTADFVVSSADDHTLRVWYDDGEEICVLDGHDAEVSSIKMVQDRVISASADGTIRTWRFGSK